MKYTFILLFAFMISCGVNDAEPEPEFNPYYNGTWYVSAPDQAEWTGDKNKYKNATAEADSIWIEDPTNHHISITQDTTKSLGNFILTFTDSTLTLADGKLDLNVFYDAGLSWKNPFSGPGSISGTTTSDYQKVKLTFHYDCSSDFSDPDNIEFRYTDRDTGDHFRSYMVVVDGIVHTVHDVSC